MWKCIFGYGNTRFCLCQDTGAMNRPLRLTECSHPISWVYVECFAECSPRIRNPFRIHSWNVRNVIAICQQHFGNPSATFWQSVRSVIGNPSAAVGSDLSRPHIRVRHPFCVCLVDIKSVLWQLCPLAKMVRLRWLCSVCLPVCRLFGYC